ncbi:MAG: DUF4250 domain-containing protein [Oscillospiraceae bacterium]|nr:DUF4250 domain-containing protein [Oscillospiraceae bacterium]
MNIPNDPFILFSYLNTQMRDKGISFQELCKEYHLDMEVLEKKLNAVGFHYDEEKRCFR